MKYVGFRGMDWNIGFRDGVSGAHYNEDANSNPYDEGFRRGRLQRSVEMMLSAVVIVGIGATLTIGWFV